jgi:hypothetical protein
MAAPVSMFTRLAPRHSGRSFGNIMRRVLAILLGLLFLSACRSVQSPPPLRRVIDPLTTLHKGVNVVCELRYYVVAPDPGQQARPVLGYPELRVLRNEGERLSCSVPEPWELLKLAEAHRMLDVKGFVLEIMQPSEYAGHFLTAHFESVAEDPFKAFAVNKRYIIEVSPQFVDDTRFKLCY